MFLPTDYCIHFGFCSAREQRQCYVTYFCWFASAKRDFSIWKTTPLSLLDTLLARISQPAIPSKWFKDGIRWERGMGVLV